MVQYTIISVERVRKAAVQIVEVNKGVVRRNTT